MLDLKFLDTAEGEETIRASFAKRGFDPEGSTLMLAKAAYTERKKAQAALNDQQSRKNALSMEFGERKKNNEPTDDLKAEIERVSGDIVMLTEMVRANGEALHNAVAQMPNLIADGVPIGGEDQNLYHPHKEPEEPTFKLKDHVTIGTKMGCMSFEDASSMSGSRFVVLSGALARLERELGQWMLDQAIHCRFVEHAVPHLVQKQAMFGTGQLPKFEDDLFCAGDHYLIPTAEVPLTNIYRERIIEVEEFEAWVVRMCALTPCYRAEAGSAGRDTRGLLRMHQFNKVEMVTVCHPDESESEHRYMLSVAESALALLGLPYRTVELASGDTGFSARKTYDLEVWIASERKYREIASISNCGDFQARRMHARWKVKATKGTQYVHTLNGSGVAVGRALLAIMEHYQTPQGGIAIPKVLRERMGASLITHDGKLV